MCLYVPSTMLFAASESAVTKKPRLRFTMSRSSSVNPLGFFQRAMSRFMLTSCGIQRFAQPERYLSHAHLYLKGTSWLTSVLALMTRLSSARTRVDGGSFCSCVEPPPLRPSPLGEGGTAGEVRPEGVEWRSCKPNVGAIGVSSSKLSILSISSSAGCALLFLVETKTFKRLPGFEGARRFGRRRSSSATPAGCRDRSRRRRNARRC